jgi:murein DD-endopeptidase MepM/ murein hydrolase activator NlpD
MPCAWLLVASLTATPMLIETHVKGSIEASLVRVNRNDGPALAAQVARLLRWRGDIVRNVQPNDDIRLLYEPGEIPELVALVYRGAEITLRAYRFEADPGFARFYDEAGTLVEPRLLDPPADYVQITETVQRGRGKRRHFGIDLKAPEGTPVVSPRAGRVSRVNWSTRVNGKCVELIYTDNTYARFLHLLEVAATTTRGAKVQAGTVIAKIGSTGRSSAPHLHYDLRDKAGTILDPLTWHGTEKVTLAGDQQNRFQGVRRNFDRIIGPSLDGEGGAR